MHVVPTITFSQEDIAAALTAQKMVKTMRTKTEDSELHHALAEQSV